MDKKSEEFKAFKMNKEKQVEIDADIFVIPNSAPSINDFLESARDEWRKNFKEVAELNGLQMPTDDDLLIQLWWTDRDKSEEYCDNLVRHIFAFEDTEGHIFLGSIPMEYFPKMWLDGYKEDETFDIILPVVTRKKSSLFSDPNKKDYAKINVRLKQKNYRYAWVGTFDEAVEKVSR